MSTKERKCKNVAVKYGYIIRKNMLDKMPCWVGSKGHLQKENYGSNKIRNVQSSRNLQGVSIVITIT
jgi:hypothetical protein